MNKRVAIVGIIWTYNPDIRHFTKCLERILPQVDYLIIVDNGSRNIDEIKGVCRAHDGNRIKLIELHANLGVEALNIGISYALKRFDPSFILILDDDTVLSPNAVANVLNEIRKFKLYERIGAICLTPATFKCKHGGYVSVPIHIFSGCIIKAQVIKSGIKIRREFFLDQADHDFFAEIRRRGYMVIARCDEDLAKHRLGLKLQTRIKIPFAKTSNYHIYEPPWRYYYIIRNSTVLVMEGKLSLLTYIEQAIKYFIPLLVVDGSVKALKALILGLAHGLFKRLGYLPPSGEGLQSVLDHRQKYGKNK